MFMKILISFVLVFFSVGCTSVPDIQEHTPSLYEEIIAMLTELETYKAAAQISYISNRNINQYDTLKAVTAEGHYFIEVTAPEHLAGNITISDTTAIHQFNRSLNKSVYLGAQDTTERTSLLLTNFAYLYLNAAQGQTNAVENDGITILTVPLQSQNPYMATLRLTVGINDDKELRPISLITYDINDDQRIVVNYLQFYHNIELDMSIFSFD